MPGIFDAHHFGEEECLPHDARALARTLAALAALAAGEHEAGLGQVSLDLVQSTPTGHPIKDGWTAKIVDAEGGLCRTADDWTDLQGVGKCPVSALDALIALCEHPAHVLKLDELGLPPDAEPNRT